MGAILLTVGFSRVSAQRKVDIMPGWVKIRLVKPKSSRFSVELVKDYENCPSRTSLLLTVTYI